MPGWEDFEHEQNELHRTVITMYEREIKKAEQQIRERKMKIAELRARCCLDEGGPTMSSSPTTWWFVMLNMEGRPLLMCEDVDPWKVTLFGSEKEARAVAAASTLGQMHGYEVYEWDTETQGGE